VCLPRDARPRPDLIAALHEGAELFFTLTGLRTQWIHDRDSRAAV
jgi:hypothetical protein